MIRIFRILIPTSTFILLLSEAVLVFACYALVAYLTLDVDLYFFLVYEGGLWPMVLAVLSILSGLYFTNLYADICLKSKIQLFWQLCEVVGMAFIFQALLGYISEALIVPRWIMLLGSAICVVVLLVWRILYGSLVVRRFGFRRILLLGTSPVLQEIAEQTAERPEFGLTTIGYLGDDAPGDAPLEGAKLLGRIGDLGEIVDATKPDRIVVEMPGTGARLAAELLKLRLSGIQIEEAGLTFEANCGRISTSELSPSQLIFSGALDPRPNSVLFQAFYSFLIALIGAVLTAPLLVLGALAVKISSRGPVLLRQTCVGRGGKAFVLYRLRSMEATRVGRFLRRTRLDELPELFNVLRGDMSMVGPAPERPEFVGVLTERIPYYRQRLCVKPGITGWAQIQSGETMDTIRKLEYDLYYIKNLSPSLDASIVFQTLKAILLTRDGQ